MAGTSASLTKTMTDTLVGDKLSHRDKQVSDKTNMHKFFWG